MEENTRKFEIKIDPLDFHVGLKDNDDPDCAHYTVGMIKEN